MRNMSGNNTKEVSSNNRNLRLDFIRIICCILIVCQHNAGLTSGSLQVMNRSDLVALGLHVLTRVAVPVFMGLSGYFMFFYKERPFDYGIRRIPRYIVMLIFWGLFYWLAGFDLLHQTTTLVEAVGVIDKTLWHLWYLKLYVVILIAFPLVRALTIDKKVLKLYVLMWLVFFSGKYTIGAAEGIIPGIQSVLQSFQIPLFVYNGYEGGTFGSERPTTYMGVFIILGAFFYMMENGKLSDKQVRFAKIGGVIGLILTETATIGLAVWKNQYMPYFEEPVELQVILMAIGFIMLFYVLPIDEMLIKNQRLIQTLAKCTLGVYIIHPFVRTLYRKTVIYSSLSGTNILLFNFVTCFLSVIVSFAIVYIFIKFVPERICKYFM